MSEVHIDRCKPADHAFKTLFVKSDARACLCDILGRVIGRLASTGAVWTHLIRIQKPMSATRRQKSGIPFFWVILFQTGLACMKSMNEDAACTQQEVPWSASGTGNHYMLNICTACTN
jgi:hypothetical protein